MQSIHMVRQVKLMQGMHEDNLLYICTLLTQLLKHRVYIYYLTAYSLIQPC